MRFVRIALIVVAVACFAVALSYPIRYHLAQKSNDAELEELSAMRARVRDKIDQTDEAVPPRAGEAEMKAETADTAAQADGEATAAQADGEATAARTPDEPVEGFAAPDGGLQAPATAGNGADTSGARLPDVGADEAPSGSPEAAEASVTGADGPQPWSEAAEASVTGADGPQPWSEATLTPGQARLLMGGAEDEETIGQSGEVQEKPAGGGEAESVKPTPIPTPTPTPGLMDLILDYEPQPTPVPVNFATPEGPPKTPTPRPTFDVAGYTGALPYSLKEKVELDESAILPELREIYALNRDLVGWITIPDTIIDYPVVQTQDSEFYLTHDFYGRENQNGQIILDTLCDPYTPSYNLVISGHHMKNGSMFGNLPEYRTKAYWEKHRFVEFDTLMARKRYVVFAAFYSADYDEDEKGFRYNVNVRYKMDAEPWLEDIRKNQLYDTQIDAVFGDEFITLTTCNRARHRNGRFVVVCRKIREGEIFE